MSRAAISSPLSPGGVSHKPAGAPSPSAPAGCIAQTLDALRLDLETHRTRAADCAALIDRLSAYTAASGTAPPQPSPPVAAKLSDADDERRARQRESMRRYRASKAAAKPKAKKQPRKHPGKKAASVVQPPADAIGDPPAVTPPTPDPPPAEDVTAPSPPVVVSSPDEEERKKTAARNLRRKIQRATRLGHKITNRDSGARWNQSPSSITAWELDENGCLSRERRTSGETPVLRDTPLPS